jgi:Sec-independent protein translocase protein TatA
VTLDWPSIALILVGVLLLFVPLEDLGALIERLEFGKTKILFRRVKQLDESFERAVNSEADADQPEDKTPPGLASN